MPDIKSIISSIKATIPDDVSLIAVTKTVSIEFIEEAIKAGITDIGENRIQEAKAKVEALRQKYPEVKWHMIGHLQRNKVRQALDIFDIIQSVDSERLALEIEAQATREVPILIEVKTSDEATKYGVPAEATIEFVKKIAEFKHLKIQGLMTIAPWFDDPEKARPFFKTLRELRDKIITLKIPNVEMKYLSMGMTDDYKVAIEEGSNMVRVGRAIFGKRS
jgi:PLP dependent protein